MLGIIRSIRTAVESRAGRLPAYLRHRRLASHAPALSEKTRQDLAKIPTDKKVIVTCKSGVRCTVIGLALRNIGFDNIYAMKGGLMGLMKYLGPKTAF